MSEATSDGLSTRLWAALSRLTDLDVINREFVGSVLLFGIGAAVSLFGLVLYTAAFIPSGVAAIPIVLGVLLMAFAMVLVLLAFTSMTINIVRWEIYG